MIDILAGPAEETDGGEAARLEQCTLVRYDEQVPAVLVVVVALDEPACGPAGVSLAALHAFPLLRKHHAHDVRLPPSELGVGKRLPGKDLVAPEH